MQIVSKRLAIVLYDSGDQGVLVARITTQEYAAETDYKSFTGIGKGNGTVSLQMKIRFLKPAQFELEDAVAWYDSHSVGLGTQFLDDLDRSVRRIVAYPFSSPEIEPDLRRCLLSRFPYGIIYGSL